MRRVLLGVPLVLFLLVLGIALPLQSKGGATWLVRTAVPEAGPSALIEDPDVMVVASERDCLVAVVGEAGLQRLHELSIDASILEADPLANNHYYTLRVSNPDFIDTIAGLVRILWRDRTTAVFAADVEAAAEVSHAAHVRGGVPCGAVVRLFLREIAGAIRPARIPERRGIGADPTIQALVNQVTQSNIEATVNDLASIPTRRANQPGGVQAQGYVVGRYQSLATPQNGLSVTTHDFDSAHDNVIAILPGAVNPEQFVVLGGHYDSINASGQTELAPGADDDGSGTASVLEACRVLRNQRFEKSIIFAAWAEEELGLVGSNAYVTQVVIPNAMDVVAMIQLDMDGYLEAGDARDVDFATNDTDPTLTAFVRQALATYVPGVPSVTGVLTAGTSDHRSFSQNGFPACFPFEDLTQYSHFLHTSGDTVGQSFNAPSLARDMTKMVVAAVAELAVPFSGLAVAHTPLVDTTDALACRTVRARAVSVGTVTSVSLVWRNSDSNAVTVPMTPTGNPNEYSATIPANPFGTLVSYYVTASDSQGRTSTLPPDAPATLYSYTTVAVNRTFFDDFETAGDNGWTHGSPDGSQDDWQHGAPDQASNNTYDPGLAYSGTNVWGNDLSPSGFNGNYANNVSNFLQSPSINTIGRTGLRLRYRRWLTVEDGIYDTARILVSGTQVFRNPQGGGSDHFIDSSWVLHDLDVAALADNRSSVILRWELQSDAGLTFGGWNIDDVSLESNASPPTITADDSTPVRGQTVSLALSAPGHGGETYSLVLAMDTAPGTALNPGVPGDCRIIPYTTGNQHDRIRSRRADVFVSFTGTLDGSGNTTAPRIIIPDRPRVSGVAVRVTGSTSGDAVFGVETIRIQ